MAGKSTHGQHNKPHKRGKHARASARTKHKISKEGGKQHIRKGGQAAAHGREQRLNEAKQLRERKRSEAMAQRRQQGPTPVIAFLPLSADVDFARLWGLILSGFAGGPGLGMPEAGPDPKKGKKRGGVEVMEEDTDQTGGHNYPLVPTTVAVPNRPKQRFTLLPPPQQRGDPLEVVDLGKAAELVVLVLPSQDEAVCLDSEGQLALSILRQLGMPTVMAVLTGSASAGSAPAATKLKERAAAKKRVAAVLDAQVPGERKIVAVDEIGDCQQLIRTLCEAHPCAPLWRRQRPSLLVDAAHFFPSSPDAGVLALRGYVRNLGLSANQLMHIPGAGDFEIERMEGAAEPSAAAAGVTKGDPSAPAAAAAMETEGPGSRLVVLPDEETRERLVRENDPDPLAGDQTWPTEKELMDAEMAPALPRRRLPKGTSDYQAAWILDDYQDGEEVGGNNEVEDVEDAEEHDQDARSPLGQTAGTAVSEFGDDDVDGMEEDEESMGTEDQVDMKKRWRDQQDDVLFPDEVDTPRETAARVRFAKYRGLRSWRSSAWDPKENLPRDYARIFAFQNPKRAAKRAKEAAEKVGTFEDFHGVPAGTYVTVHVRGVPTAAAAGFVEHVAASLQGKAVPPVVFGLLENEGKLSVVNFSVRKAAGFDAVLPNKSTLLLVTGLRSFTSRPIFSVDEPTGTRFKMERFLHAGRQTMMTVYAPICFPPLPILAFHRAPDGTLQLAASGTLRSCDPDRIVLKKVVLSGYPVKVHKKKAVVRWMFFTPEDVRWFRPLELWTKHGRRGVIKEPIGTHGSMKCLFDAPVKQQDAVCLSLYKRTYPVWPSDTSPAAFA